VDPEVLENHPHYRTYYNFQALLLELFSEPSLEPVYPSVRGTFSGAVDSRHAKQELL